MNKVETRVTLVFDVLGSESLSEAQKMRIMTELGGRIDSKGVLRISVSSTRSQLTNKTIAKERLAELLAEALKTRKKRKKTRPTLASKRRRVDAKKKRSQIKQSRGRVSRDD